MLAAMAGVTVLAAPAQACQAVERTPETALQYQRLIASKADSIYLARAVPHSGVFDGSIYRRVVVIEGQTPPRSLTAVPLDCKMPDEGLIIVFAEQIRPRQALFEPWLWWNWVVSTVYPSEVVDPALAERLRRTADRLGSSARK
ncbi:hypothetical protein [Brevundimonas sp.]|uniref:hypothetical protein n=1 Tax=Brevundimonas sp. TaxID=1871086 RepID=UPI003A9112AA